MLKKTGMKFPLLLIAIIIITGVIAYAASSTSPGYLGWMMGGGFNGMMGGYNYNSSNSGQSSVSSTVDMNTAKTILKKYLEAIGNPNLKLAEIMEFDNHFYAEIQEIDSKKYAMELIVDKITGAVSPEMGPNMMWNTKYGHMGRMMGWAYNRTTLKNRITAEQALQLAQQYLDKNLPGVKAVEPHEFYGYYTLHTKKDGKITGMLSVNGVNGSIWYHSWHGQFLSMEENE
ncbi:hypothetical protein [Carboxydothermus pertinax]|uniref:Peptidase M4 n=1 Tax=Carboxydothermus pertinax TaxID=870242 RepID=A0A1L8CSP4_9THEO|nr:hypothetical protein [Carboxydothermus pertinax]GAV21839.1 hypothetical protein cpu_03490 [Carboxydothermus pertinax]